MNDLNNPFGLSVQPGVNPNETRINSIIAGGVILIVLPTIAVTLRLASRWVAKASLWWDDYTVILTLFFSWANNILPIITTKHGLGKHSVELTLDDWHAFFKSLYVWLLLYTLALGSVKYSIILFQYRIFPIVHFRRGLLGCLIFVTCWLIASTFVTIFQCVPVDGFWETLGGVLTRFYPGQYRCIRPWTNFLATGAINTAMNFVLLAMPIPLVWKLRTTTAHKLVLTSIFTAGLVVCAVSIVRLVLVANTDKHDISWSYGRTVTWTAAEPSIAVVSACLPSLRPLFARILLGRAYVPKAQGSSSNSRGRTGGGAGAVGSNSNSNGSGTFATWRRDRLNSSSEDGEKNLALTSTSMTPNHNKIGGISGGGAQTPGRHNNTTRHNLRTTRSAGPGAAVGNANQIYSGWTSKFSAYGTHQDFGPNRHQHHHRHHADSDVDVDSDDDVDMTDDDDDVDDEPVGDGSDLEMGSTSGTGQGRNGRNGRSGRRGRRRSAVPERGIKVRTTVTVTQKVDYRYDLF